MLLPRQGAGRPDGLPGAQGWRARSRVRGRRRRPFGRGRRMGEVDARLGSRRTVPRVDGGTQPRTVVSADQRSTDGSPGDRARVRSRALSQGHRVDRVAAGPTDRLPRAHAEPRVAGREPGRGPRIILVGSWFEPTHHIREVVDVRTRTVADRNHCSTGSGSRTTTGCASSSSRGTSTPPTGASLKMSLMCAGFRPWECIPPREVTRP